LSESIPADSSEEVKAIIEKYNLKTKPLVENEKTKNNENNISITEVEKGEKKESNEDEN
jgi:hypothetical protein